MPLSSDLEFQNITCLYYIFRPELLRLLWNYWLQGYLQTNIF